MLSPSISSLLHPPWKPDPWWVLRSLHFYWLGDDFIAFKPAGGILCGRASDRSGGVGRCCCCCCYCCDSSLHALGCCVRNPQAARSLRLTHPRDSKLLDECTCECVLCVCIRACVCAHAAATVGQQQQWTSISFLPTTEINHPPSCISQLPPRVCSPPLPRLPPPKPPARVPPEGGQDSCAVGRIPPFFRSDRRIPGPPRHPLPPQSPLSQSRSPHPTTVDPLPPSSRSPRRQLQARAPPLSASPAQVARAWRGNQTWRARRRGARVSAQASLYKEPAFFGFGDSSTSGASPNPKTSASFSLAPTRRGRGKGGIGQNLRRFSIGQNGPAGAGQLAN